MIFAADFDEVQEFDYQREADRLFTAVRDHEERCPACRDYFANVEARSRDGRWCRAGNDLLSAAAAMQRAAFAGALFDGFRAAVRA